jgi:hypothetical protein
MSTHERYHKKVPAELYEKATKTDLSYKIDNVKNNSVQKYMSEIKSNANNIPNVRRLD